MPWTVILLLQLPKYYGCRHAYSPFSRSEVKNILKMKSDQNRQGAILYPIRVTVHRIFYYNIKAFDCEISHWLGESAKLRFQRHTWPWET